MKWTKEEVMDLTGEGVPDFGDVAAMDGDDEESRDA